MCGHNLNQTRLWAMLAGMALAGSAALAQTPPTPGEWNKILAGAQSEGKVVLYTGITC